MRDRLAGFLRFPADEPHRADMMIVEVLAAGPAAVALEVVYSRILGGQARELPSLVADLANALMQPHQLALRSIKAAGATPRTTA